MQAGTIVVVAMTAASLVVVLAVTASTAMDQRDSTVPRTVRGTVVDFRGRPLTSSIVFLHQQKTLEIRTQIADDNGQYRFSGLNPHTDYQIHAEHGDWTSSVHTLCGADGKGDVVLDLRVDKRRTRMLLLQGVRATGNMFVLLAEAMAESAVPGSIDVSVRPWSVKHDGHNWNSERDEARSS